MSKLIDLTGKRFGKLVVLERAENDKGRSQWLCRCDCGNLKVINGSNLRHDKSHSCGCLCIGNHTKHGYSDTRLYHVWHGMRQRCNYPKHNEFKHYGGRGIRVCDEWNNSFMAFHDWAMSYGYLPDAPRGKCTLDRIDINGNYEPSNCRWVDMKTQMLNRQ